MLHSEATGPAWLRCSLAIFYMNSLRALQGCGLAAMGAGVVVACFTHKAPQRGWIALLLLLVASGAWALIEAGESSQPSNLPMFVTFLFIAPVAIAYAFRARKSAPDGAIALAAYMAPLFYRRFYSS